MEVPQVWIYIGKKFKAEKFCFNVSRKSWVLSNKRRMASWELRRKIDLAIESF